VIGCGVPRFMDRARYDDSVRISLSAKLAKAGAEHARLLRPRRSGGQLAMTLNLGSPSASSPSIVRPAIPADHSEIWRLFKLHAEENALFPLSERKVEFYLQRLLHPGEIAADDTGPRGLLGVIGPVGALEGAIMLVLGSPWYTDEITLDDCMNFVDPAHRKSSHAKSLIAYSKHLVDQVRLGHPDFKMILGVMSTERTAPKIRLYSQQMGLVGAFFMYPSDSASGVKLLKNMHRTN
jgi:hypothetical protein